MKNKDQLTIFCLIILNLNAILCLHINVKSTNKQTQISFRNNSELDLMKDNSETRKNKEQSKDLRLNVIKINGVANSTNNENRQSGILFQIKPIDYLVLTSIKINVSTKCSKKIKVYILASPISRVFEKISNTQNLKNWELIVNNNFHLEKYQLNTIFNSKYDMYDKEYSVLITEYESETNNNCYITANHLRVTDNYETEFAPRSDLSNNYLNVSEVVFVNEQSELGLGPKYFINQFSGELEFKRMIKIIDVSYNKLSYYREKSIGTNNKNDIIDFFNTRSDKGFVVDSNDGFIQFELNFPAEFTQIQVQGVNLGYTSSQDGSNANIYISVDKINWSLAGKLPTLNLSVQTIELEKKCYAKFLKVIYPNSGRDTSYKFIGISFFRILTY